MKNNNIRKDVPVVPVVPTEQAEKEIGVLFYTARRRLEDYSLTDLTEPDKGLCIGKRFWLSLARDCEEIVKKDPRQLETVADMYDEMWSFWKEARGSG